MKTKKLLGKLATAFGILAAFLFVFLLIPQSVADLLDGKTDGIPILILMLISVAGLGIAFRKSRKGGLIMLVTGGITCLYLFIMAGGSELLMPLLFTLPLLIPGTIFVLFGKAGK
jgi:CHASE2 domain-containing sensor protein